MKLSLFFNITAIFDVKCTSYFPRYKKHVSVTNIATSLRDNFKMKISFLTGIQDTFNINVPFKLTSAKDNLTKLFCHCILKAKFGKAKLCEIWILIKMNIPFN